MSEHWHQCQGCGRRFLCDTPGDCMNAYRKHKNKQGKNCPYLFLLRERAEEVLE